MKKRMHYLNLSGFLDMIEANPDWTEHLPQALRLIPRMDEMLAEMAYLDVVERKMMRSRIETFRTQLSDYITEHRISFKKEEETSSGVPYDQAALFAQLRGEMPC